jgi:hypothetical protein
MQAREEKVVRLLFSYCYYFAEAWLRWYQRCSDPVLIALTLKVSSKREGDALL